MKHKRPYYLRKVTEFGKLSHSGFKGLEGHYLLIIPLKIKTKLEADRFRGYCKTKTEYCNFGFMGRRCNVYTNGFTQQLRPMIPLLKNKVLEYCQKNPARYLYGDEK